MERYELQREREGRMSRARAALVVLHVNCLTHIALKVQDVQLDRGQETLIGTLHLTVHHLIFSHSEDELWVISSLFIHIMRLDIHLPINRYPILLYIQSRDNPHRFRQDAIHCISNAEIL